MRAKPTHAPNSRKARFPKRPIPVRKPREGWAESFAAMAKRGDDRLLLDHTPNEFDRVEWTW
ncbi:MAG TPA: hypothetical protein VEU96_07490 [Bryobacteraceae bacterium]|nr:hypothetical protein [Bryobacteraceae bacterium]